MCNGSLLISVSSVDRQLLDDYWSCVLRKSYNNARLPFISNEMEMSISLVYVINEK